jgi:mannose/cellobiose epimerase-like protein (N-acyl-D-glucosamine 2-epimerase family)
MTECQELVLWKIWMCFDLIYGWHDSCVLEECGQGFNAEVGDADIFDFSCDFFPLQSGQVHMYGMTACQNLRVSPCSSMFRHMLGFRRVVGRGLEKCYI